MNKNPFENIISKNFKNLFNQAIDGLLSQNSLTLPCKIRYDTTQKSQALCNNCYYDPISMISSNKYNSTGPQPFVENTICPICFGNGIIDSVGYEETVYLGVIFDSKYFINYNRNLVNIPTGAVQTICKIELIDKIRNANEVVFDTNLDNRGQYTFQRNGDPEPCGFGDNKYIITMWVRK